MRNIISLAHISIDGFMAGPGGDMSFLSMNDEMADHIYPRIGTVDTSVYGRVTYQMMEGYWPSVVGSATATAHEKHHASWYTSVRKLVASRTITSQDPTVRVVGDDIVGAVRAEKEKTGGDIMIFASPSLTHTLVAAGLVDQYMLTFQPVIVGAGLRLFEHVETRSRLELRDSKTFRNGVIAAHYVMKR